MKLPSTGELNQKIIICNKQVGTNEYGGGTDSFPEYWTTYAKVEPLRSSRTLEANQSQLMMVARFTVRSRKDKEIYNDMLVKWRKQTLIIQNYIPDPTYQEFATFDGAIANAGNIMQSTNTSD